MRTVFDDRELPHIWASQTQGEGRSPGMFFRGNTIYSYGYHFPMAALLDHGGARVALFTTRRYSVTTSKHLGYTRGALPRNVRTFYVPLPDGWRGDNPDYARLFKHFPDAVRRKLTDAATSRNPKKARLVGEAQRLVREGNEFAEFFGLPDRLTLPDDVDAAIKEVADQIAKEAEAARVAEAARRKKELAKFKRALSAWRRGEQDYVPYHRDRAWLRLSADGATVETTMGARVPVAHAVRAYRIFARLMERGEGYRRNGHTVHIGRYAAELLDVANRTLTVGCHVFDWGVVEEFAKAHDWDTVDLDSLPKAPDDECATV